MVNINLKSFIPFIPLTIFAGSSIFGRQLDQNSANNFKAATEAKLSVLSDLEAHPINGEGGKAYWSGNLTSLKDSGANVIDGKLLLDGSSIATVGAMHYGLGMLTATVSALPLVPYLATPVMAYSEYTRGENFKTVINQYWKPSCDADNLQGKLKAAGDVGNSYNPEEYANFISRAYGIETLSVVAEFVTVGAGLHGLKTPVKIVADAGDPAAISKAGAAVADTADISASVVSESVVDTASTPASVVPESVKGMASDVPAPAAPGYIGRATETAAHYAAGAAYGIAYGTTIIANRAQVVVEAAANTGITGRDLAVGSGAAVGAFAIIGAYLNSQPIADSVNSAAHMLSDGAYAAVCEMVGARNSEIGGFVKAREEVRSEVMSGFLKAQFDICASEDSASVAKTYTQGCGTSTHEIIDNLLAGAEGCSYVS